ncbi:MAG TPA: hypothetical protein VGS60_10760, partial [Actinomycetes bacterium]|nr:hypothetical protein [Actinomycetes bacterium]
TEPRELGPGRAAHIARAELVNGSDDLISNVDVRLEIEWPDIDSDETVRRYFGAMRVLPGERLEVGPTSWEGAWNKEGGIGPVLVLGEVFFTDAAGVRWHRDTEHRLSEVRAPRDEIPEETPEPSGPVVPGYLLRPGELVVPVRESEETSPQHESRDDP